MHSSFSHAWWYGLIWLHFMQSMWHKISGKLEDIWAKGWRASSCCHWQSYQQTCYSCCQTFFQCNQSVSADMDILCYITLSIIMVLKRAFFLYWLHSVFGSTPHAFFTAHVFFSPELREGKLLKAVFRYGCFSQAGRTNIFDMRCSSRGHKCTPWKLTWRVRATNAFYKQNFNLFNA